MILSAVTVDDATLNWIYGLIGIALPVIGTTIVLLWKKFLAYITPKVTDAFNAHTGLVTEMTTQLPIVGASLKKLCETQEKQCQTQDKHTEDHKNVLKEINDLRQSLSGGHDTRS